MYIQKNKCNIYISKKMKHLDNFHIFNMIWILSFKIFNVYILYMRNYRRKTLKGGWQHPKTKAKTPGKKTKTKRSAGLVLPRSRRRRRRRNSRT